jgi:hypothetical protein
MAYIHHRHYPLSPIIGAKTPVAAAVSTPFPLVAGVLHSMRIQIPSGHNGVTGVRITYQGQQIMPWSNLAWLVGSGDTFTLAWDAEVMDTGLAVVAYNLDLVPHQFWLLADVTPHQGANPGATPAIAATAAPPASMLASIAGLAG